MATKKKPISKEFMVKIAVRAVIEATVNAETFEDALTQGREIAGAGDFFDSGWSVVDCDSSLAGLDDYEAWPTGKE